jgi:hypothetical protein
MVQALTPHHHIADPTPRLPCSVGVIANSHEATILPLLTALAGQHLHRVEIAEIIVVVDDPDNRRHPSGRDRVRRVL